MLYFWFSKLWNFVRMFVSRMFKLSSNVWWKTSLHGQIKKKNVDIPNPFPHIDAIWCLCCRRLWLTLWKRRYCSKQAISPLATIISTLFHNKTLIYEDFSCFCQKKIQCCLLQICCMWVKHAFFQFMGTSASDRLAVFTGCLLSL